MKRWTVVFKALSNFNRLKIIKILSSNKRMNVGEIAKELKVSFTATSNHLIILEKLEVLEAEGASGHVFYNLNSEMPSDFEKAITLLK